MNILVTGSNGFVGKNLVETLKNIRDSKDTTKNISLSEIYCFDVNNSLEELDIYVKNCDFIINLAGINRPNNSKDFYEGNKEFIEILCKYLKKHENICPIIASSSIQVGKDNDYAKSKKEGEEYLQEFSRKHGNPTYIYRFSNLFGKWCRPNYNSVIATWCYNIANDIEIQINNPETVLPLCYIDDVVNEIISCIQGNPLQKDDYYIVEPIYQVTLMEIADQLTCFKQSRKCLSVIKQSDDFVKKLYATYLSYLPINRFSYPLKMNVDNRGSFTEFIKTQDYGQISINISKPGVVKGNHWHHTKNEKFLVVNGNGIIRFRKIGDTEVIEYKVSGEELEVIDIPVGYTHNIENIGSTNMVTVMWANEIFDLENPDTFFEEVEK